MNALDDPEAQQIEAAFLSIQIKKSKELNMNAI